MTLRHEVDERMQDRFGNEIKTAWNKLENAFFIEVKPLNEVPLAFRIAQSQSYFTASSTKLQAKFQKAFLKLSENQQKIPRVPSGFRLSNPA